MKVEVGKWYTTSRGDSAFVKSPSEDGLFEGFVLDRDTGLREGRWHADGISCTGQDKFDSLVSVEKQHEKRLQRLEEDIYQIRQNAARLNKLIGERCNYSVKYTNRVDERVGDLTSRVDQLRDMVDASFKRIEGIDENLEVWNDELTKVDQTEKATTDSDCDEDKPNHFVDDEFLAKCKKKLYHGFALTLEDQRELWQQASGEWLERKGRRCPECGGIGLRGERDGLTITGDHPRVELLCNRCNGDGYVSRETQKGK